jgi:hypothetical protein
MKKRTNIKPTKKDEGMVNRILGSVQAFWDRYTNKPEEKSEAKPEFEIVKANKKSKKKKY